MSLLRVAPKRTTECKGVGVVTRMCGNPARPRPRGSVAAALTRLSPTASTPPDQNALTWHYALILDWPGRPRTVSTTCAMWYRGTLASTTYHSSRSGPGADRLSLALDVPALCRRSGARSGVYTSRPRTCWRAQSALPPKVSDHDWRAPDTRGRPGARDLGSFWVSTPCARHEKPPLGN